MATEILTEAERASGGKRSGLKRAKRLGLVGRRVSAFRCDACGELFKPGTAACPRHGATLSPVDPLVGRVVDRTYRLDRLIGQGGMSDVYAAQHITLPGEFAVKVLIPRHAKDPSTVKRFQREAEAQSIVGHDNALRVIGFGHDVKNDLHYCATELVAGGTLRDAIQAGGPMPVARAVDISCQVLCALQAAHDKGILHRDLKPQNIMLVESGGQPDRVRVLDFGGKPIERGLSVDQKARTMLTLPGTLFGTPAYMAPEQARGEALDERVDIYAAAVTLLHMLLGRSPFKGKDLEGTLTNVLTMTPPRPSLVGDATRGIPPGLEAVILKALNKDPDLRFESARAFRDALLRFSSPDGPRRGPRETDEPSTRESLLRVFRTTLDEDSRPRPRAAA